MSRIGRLPVAIPAGVTVDIQENNHVVVKGPKGTLERTLPSEMTIKLEDGHVVVTRPNDLKKMKALHGLTRTLIHNMVIGVSEGYTKTLEVNGVGYRAAISSVSWIFSSGRDDRSGRTLLRCRRQQDHCFRYQQRESWPVCR